MNASSIESKPVAVAALLSGDAGVGLLQLFETADSLQSLFWVKSAINPYYMHLTSVKSAAIRRGC
jgi:hypothetical protein